MMTIDLSDCEMIYKTGQDLDTILRNAGQQIIPQLTEEILVIVLAADHLKHKRTNYQVFILNF